MTKAKDQAPPDLLRRADIADRLFAYILEKLPEMARTHVLANQDEIMLGVGREFGGAEAGHIYRRKELQQQALARDVMAIFNGCNATEVARKLQISRATVYRIIKQPGARKLSQVPPET